MKMHCRYVINYALTCMLSMVFFAQTSNASGLNETMIAAYQNNPELKAARANLKSVDENASQAFSGWLPNVSGSFERGRRDTVFGNTESDEITDTRGITVTQPVFRGGRTIAAMSEASNTIKAERYSLMATEQSILQEAVQAYMDIVQNTEVLNLSKSNEAVMKEHLHVTKERFSLGEVTTTDVSQAEASYADATSSRIQAEGALESSRATYLRAVGIEPQGVVMPAMNQVSIDQSLTELLKIARENNPSVLSAIYSEKALDDVVDGAIGVILPEVNLVGAMQEQKGQLFSGGSDIETETISVQVSIPLYQSGAEYSQVRQSKANVERARYDLLSVREQVDEAVTAFYQDYQVANASIRSNQASVKAFETALKGTEEEAKVGSRTTLDVLDAQQDVFEAKVNLVRSKRDKIVSAHALLALTGALTAEVMKLDTEIYDAKAHHKAVKYRIIGF